MEGNALGVADLDCSVVSILNVRGPSSEAAMLVACVGLATSHIRSELATSGRRRSRRFYARLAGIGKVVHDLQKSYCKHCKWYYK